MLILDGWGYSPRREGNAVALARTTHYDAVSVKYSRSLLTANPVPFHLVDDRAENIKLRSGGALEDVAPTILGILQIEKPAEMTGRDLREI